MKILTVLGTRPEIIRLSRIIPKLDVLCEHVVAHTGQNFDDRLSKIFFEELGLRSPDHNLNCRGETLMQQIAKIMIETEKIINEERPDRILILGDTNSALSSIVAKRMGIPVFHMEAGNRCYDDRVPEEVNRRIIDHSSDVLMPYSERSRSNLLREGIQAERIFVIGNPIKEVLDYYSEEICSSNIMDNLGLEEKRFFLVTLHRAENVDLKHRLENFITTLSDLNKKYKVPVVCSIHPRTRSKLDLRYNDLEKEGLIALEPMGLFDFVHLEKNAMCTLTDSGTVQEECCLFRVPNVTLRDVTERPETVEVGSNILSGAKTEDVQRCIDVALHKAPEWNPPPEYMMQNVSSTVTKIVLGYNHKRGADCWKI